MSEIPSERTVDAAVNYFGKPHMTAVAIASLLEHCGRWINRIFLICEQQQPPDGPMIHDIIRDQDWPIEVFIPKFYLGWDQRPSDFDLLKDQDLRFSVRYEYALQKTNKPFLFVFHNDILVERDIVGRLLEVIAESGSSMVAGAGLVGQCWNCPAQLAGKCSSDTRHEFNPNYFEAMALYSEFPGPRAIGAQLVDRFQPMPMPECRLNEHACIVDTHIYRSEAIPAGDAPLLGLMGGHGLDTGADWYQAMCRRGYDFRHVNILEYLTHSWVHTDHGGHGALFDESIYRSDEDKARQLYEARYAL